MRIALVHALKHSIVPIKASFARLWPDASLMNLLDDSLSADVARDGRLTSAMTDRFLSLGRYAVSTGADAILFASPSAAQSFFDQAAVLKLAAKAKRPLAGSIGPSTTVTMKQLGLPVDFEAADASLDSLVAALVSKLSP